MGLRMHHDGVEKSKHREKYRCPLADRKNGCKCPDPCSDSNMEEPSIFSKRTIQDYLTYRHGTVHNGKQSTTNAPLLKDLTNAKR